MCESAYTHTNRSFENMLALRTARQDAEDCRPRIATSFSWLDRMRCLSRYAVYVFLVVDPN